MNEQQYKYRYRVQVPRKIPNIAIKDTRGRNWVKASSVSDEYIQWDIGEDVWYVWFKNEDVPEEGEIIEFSDNEYTVESVYWYKRLQRAMVVF